MSHNRRHPPMDVWFTKLPDPPERIRGRWLKSIWCRIAGHRVEVAGFRQGDLGHFRCRRCGADLE